MNRIILAAGLAATAALSGCMREVLLTPQSTESAAAALPLSVRVELTESAVHENSATPIRFDLKQAAQSYLKSRGTFRELVASGEDATLKIRSHFNFEGKEVFYYTFDLQTSLQGGSKALGAWKTSCTARGGMTRMTTEADREPMNRAITECMAKLTGQIEAEGPTILAKLQGAGAPAAVAAAPVPAAPKSDVDEPGYKRSENPDDFALVIGIERYESLPPADFAEHDAAAVRRHLLALGYPERNIVFLTGSKAGRSGIEKYVETWLPLNVKENSRLFVYFSGHGAPDTKDGSAYLVPWDGDAKFLKNTGYPLKKFYASLNALKAKQVLVAMDACFTGEGGRSVLAKGARPLVTKVDTGLDGSDKLVVLAAAAGDEITATREADGHGLFTYYLLKGLGAKNGTGTVKELYDFLTPKVQDEARRDGRDQTPQLLGPRSSSASF